MKCKEFSLLLDSYLKEEISLQERDALEQHYFECDRCFLELQIRDRLHSKEARIVPAGKKPAFSLLPKPLLAAASVMLLVVFSFALIALINNLNHKKMLVNLTAFEPPVYMTSETRSPAADEKFAEAMAFYNREMFKEALDILEEIKRSEPQTRNPRLAFFKGICHLITRDAGAAAEEFAVILEDMNPSYYDEAIYYNAIAMVRLGKIAQVKEQLRNLADMFSPYAPKARALLEKLAKEEL